MSTTTPNYGLVKPELTDAADITAMNPNWDKIDEELKKKYDADNKPTASDVGAAPANEHIFKSYSHPSQFGVTTGGAQMTMTEIISAMPNYSELTVGIDLAWNSAEFPSLYGTLNITKAWNGRVAATFVSVGNGVMWYGSVDTSNNNVFAGWNQLFKADGSVSMSGAEFYTNNKKGRVYTGANNLSIHHLKNGAESQDVDTRFIEMYSDSLDFAQAFKVGQYVGGTVTRRNIFGEHNKPSGSYTGNGSATERTINVGGIGGLLCIRGNGATALVSDSGAILFTQSGTTITKLVGSEIKFENGILTIATNNTGVNKSGLVYNYRLL